MKKKLSKYRVKTISSTAILLLALIFVLGSCSSETTTTEITTSVPAASSETSAAEATVSTTAAATSSETTAEPSPAPELVLLPPVETNPPGSDYEPAFDGQTRAPGTKTEDELYSVALLTSELNSPWAVTALPDDRLVITEQAGTIRLMTMDGQLSEPIGGFPEVDNRSQGGLLDVAPAPDFSDSRMLYFTLAEATSQGSLTAVGRGRLADDDSNIEDFEIIWRAIPYFDNSSHFGSRLVFDHDGNIFATTGERSDLRTRPNAQLLNTAHGKVVRITPDGEPAPDNPFAGVEGALPEIYSYGHRNVQGLALHPQTGDVWISEMGPKGGDELNLIEAGRNYGWPEISYGTEYSGEPVGAGLTAQDGMEQPVYYWDPSLAPSGMTFYTSDRISQWQGSLFIGGLVSRHIARLVIEDGRVIAEERLLVDEGERFRDIGEGPDGALYAITDSGRLYRIG